MATQKTRETTASVEDFINTASVNEQQRADGFELLKLMKTVTGYEPKMWGPAIVGFGHYHYKYASGHEGDAPFVGFSPRKAAISLYVFTGAEEHEYLLEGLGKFRKGKACLYVSKLSDINDKKLGDLIKATIKYLSDKYGN